MAVKEILFFLMLNALLTMLPASGMSQEVVPLITNFSSADYQGANQNWGVTQDEQGFIYVANHSGLLVYDGETWQLFPMPNNTIVRSTLSVGEQIYVGSYEEFGYWEMNDKGRYQYTSISALLGDYEFANDEFWEIVQVKDRIVFRSFSAVYIYDGVAVTPISYESTPLKMAVLNDELFISYQNRGVYKLTDSYEHQFIMNTPDLLKPRVSKMLSLEKKMLICNPTEACFWFDGYGFQKWETEAQRFFAATQINDISVLNNGDLVFGTIQKGLMVTDANGGIKYNIDRTNGLTNNTVLDVFTDKDENTWVASDDGISLIKQKSPFRQYTDNSGALGAVYTSATYSGNTYLGSNKGVFYFKDNQLIKVSDINGQVWDLKVIDGQLFCGHNNGTSIIENGRARQISNFPGGWQIKQIPNTNSYIQCTYTGLILFKKVEGKWQASRINSFLSPIKYMAFENQNTLWAAHAYKGLYKISLSKDFSKINTIQDYSNRGLSSPYNLEVVNFANQILISDRNKWNEYDPIRDTIIQNSSIQERLGDTTYTDILGNNDQELWLSNQEEVVQLSLNTDDLRKISLRGIKNRLINFSGEISVVNDTTDLITLNNGWAEYRNGDASASKTPLKRGFIRSAATNLQHLSLSNPVDIPHTQNTITITFATPDYNNSHLYQYRLVNKDNNKAWETTSTNKITFSNLKPGKYTFSVVPVSSNNQDSIEPATWTFTILPPWYRSFWASIFYGLLAVGLVWMFTKAHFRRLDKHKAELTQQFEKENQEQLEKETYENEKRVIELEKRQLETELQLKSQELANSTMTLVKKNEALTEIKNELLEIQQEKPNLNISKVLKNIDRSLDNEEDWKLFETTFNQVHKAFLDRLKADFPELTSKDLKLGAFIRMGLSSKEIAPLMNISTRGIETHRYRLRKKLNLSGEENLNEILENY